MKVVDASFVAGMSRYLHVPVNNILKSLDSENTTFILKEKPKIKLRGRVILRKSFEDCSVKAFEIYMEKKGCVLYTDEAKVAEALYITGTFPGGIVVPPSRAGNTMVSVLPNARLAVPVKYPRERRYPLNLKGAKRIRYFLESFPEAKIYVFEEPKETPAIILSKEKDGLEDNKLYFKVFPIISKHSIKYPIKVILAGILLKKMEMETCFS